MKRKERRKPQRVRKMNEKNTVHVGSMIGNLTMEIVNTTKDIQRTQKLFSECDIVLEEKYAADLTIALNQLLAEINKMKRVDEE